jgi:DNA-binding transcriptional regulator YhcF (GntR family)
MAPTNRNQNRENGVGQVRARLLSALHVGRLRSGDRVLSVRRLANLTGINPKTVHRAYTALAQEGVLEVRPGSGTFVSERRSGVQDLPPTRALLSIVERCRSDALQLELTPTVLTRFLQICLCDGLREVSVGLVECNWEQITIIGRDLRRSLGVQIKPIPLSSLERDGARALGGVNRIVTTDCHYADVVESLESHDVWIHTVTLDQQFPRQILRIARTHDVLLVVHDPHFGPVFTRLLETLADDSQLLRRIHVVDAGRAAASLRVAHPETRVFLSSLVKPSIARQLPGHTNHRTISWGVEPAAIETLRAGLGLDLVLQQAVR